MPASDDHVVDVIGAYALGALEDPESRAVEGHLLFCDRCRDALKATMDAIILSGRDEGIRPPPEVWERIRAQLRERGAG